MVHNHENPYSSPSAAGQPQRPLDLPVSDAVPQTVLVQRGFLYRRIQVRAPFAATLEYRAYGLREMILIDHYAVVSRVKWWWFGRRFDFRVHSGGRFLPVTIAVRLWPWLAIRSFRVVCEQTTIYEE